MPEPPTEPPSKPPAPDAKAGKEPKAPKGEPPQQAPAPTVGRIVHFFKAPIAKIGTAILTQEPLAALIVAVHDSDTVTLHVFGSHPHSDHIVDAAVRSDEKLAGRWMWPQREGAAG